MPNSTYPDLSKAPEYLQVRQLSGQVDALYTESVAIESKVSALSAKSTSIDLTLTALDSRVALIKATLDSLSGAIATPSATWEIHGGRNLFGASPIVFRGGLTRLSKLFFQNFDTNRVYLILMDLPSVSLTVGASVFAGRCYSFDNNGAIHLDHNYWNEPGAQVSGVGVVRGLAFNSGLWIGLSTSPETWQPAPLASSFRIELGGA